MRKIVSVSEYPEDWPEIALRVKSEASWKCERCHHGHDPSHGYTLTVHHLDHDKGNEAKWNLAALCQRCHLRFECKSLAQVLTAALQPAMFFESEVWLKWRVAYFREALNMTKGEWLSQKS